MGRRYSESIQSFTLYVAIRYFKWTTIRRCFYLCQETLTFVWRFKYMHTYFVCLHTYFVCFSEILSSGTFVRHFRKFRKSVYEHKYLLSHLIENRWGGIWRTALNSFDSCFIAGVRILDFSIAIRIVSPPVYGDSYRIAVSEHNTCRA